MKNFFKSMVFVIGFVIIYVILSYLFLPRVNLKKYGLYNTSMYEILGENPNTIDVIVLGDSLVYSSVSPMDIYGEYGFTVFSCAEPAQILSDTYRYFKVAMDSQNPKIVMIEANILFRNALKRPWYNRPLKVLKNSLPLVTYHNNWKSALFTNGHINSWTTVAKGYKKNTDINPSYNYNYMKVCKKEKKIPDENLVYFQKIYDYCQENNVKMVLIGLPSQKSWGYAKHNRILRLADEYDLEYINYNFDDMLHIDWVNETKDNGSHLNDSGAKKVSKLIGEYLSNLNMLENHKSTKGYEEWDRAFQFFLKS